MSSFRNLRNKSTMLVLIIITLCALLTGGILLLLILLGAIPSAVMAKAWVAPSVVLAGCIIGALLASFMMRFYIKPLDDLVVATKRISEGDFSVRVGGNTRIREIGQLIENFNGMAHELEGIEMFRSDFINNFSHEFKTPIVSIRGFARQLADSELSEEDRLKYTEIIVAESERLSNMATNVLLLSKLENLELIAEKKEYSLDEQLRNCILLFEKEWNGKGIELDIDFEDIRYHGNEELMSHIWINLIGNAVKYTPKNGRIVFRAFEKDGEIVVKIADSGIGMSRDTMEKIFDKFYQGDRSHSETGNGLGLPLVKRIVELCSGRVVVESEEGKGTEFTVCLPF